MLGQMIVIFMTLALWPLIVESIILALLTWSLINHVPSIYSRHRWDTWLWLALGLVLIVQTIASILVFRHPNSNFPDSLAATPSATLGLILSSLALFGWVVPTEIEARSERLRQERLMETGDDLDSYLTGFPVSPSTDRAKVASVAR